MYSAPSKKDIILTIYSDNRTVFRLSDIALLSGETNFQVLNKKLNYYVRTGKLANPRKGIYAKPDYDIEELASNVYTPSYISLEYVLQKSGIIFQYDSVITSVSYLSRTIEVDNNTFRFNKIKGKVLVNTEGISIKDNYVNIASAERAFLDLMYLNTAYYLDNLNPLNKSIVYKLTSIYQSKSLEKRIRKII